MAHKNRFEFRAAVYLIVLKGDKVLLLRRYNTGWQDGKYTLPAWHVDGNETVISAMIREAKEEIGITLKKRDLKVIHVMHRLSGDAEYFDIFLNSEKWKGQPVVGEPDKCDEVKWFSLRQLPDNLLSYINSVLLNYRNKVFFSELGFDTTA